MFKKIIKYSGVFCLLFNMVVDGSALEKKAILANDVVQEAKEEADDNLLEVLRESCMSKEEYMKRYYFLDEKEWTQADKKRAEALEGSNKDFVNESESNCLKSVLRLFERSCNLSINSNKQQISTLFDFKKQLSDYQTVTRPEMRYISLQAYNAFVQCSINNATEDQKQLEKESVAIVPKSIEDMTKQEKINMIEKKLPDLGDKELISVINNIQKIVKKNMTKK